VSDAVAHRRELGRERSKRHRERLKFYGKPGSGYRITRRVIPSDVADLLAQKYPPIAAALHCDDNEELGRLLDSLEAAFAYGELGSFEEDPSGYVG
jgi:hypothetical protein